MATLLLGAAPPLPDRPQTSFLQGTIPIAAFAGILAPSDPKTASPAPTVALVTPAATPQAASAGVIQSPQQRITDPGGGAVLTGTPSPPPFIPLQTRLRDVAERSATGLLAGVVSQAAGSISQNRITPSVPDPANSTPPLGLLAGYTLVSSASGISIVPDPRTPAAAPTSALLSGVPSAPTGSLLVNSIAPIVPDLARAAPFSLLLAGYTQVASSSALLAPSIAPLPPDRPASSLLVGIATSATGFMLVQTAAPPAPDRPVPALLAGYGASGPNYITVVAQPVAERPATGLLAGAAPITAPIYALAPSIAPLPPDRPASSLLAGVTTSTTGSMLEQVLPPAIAERPYTSVLRGFVLVASGAVMPVPVAPPVAERPYAATLQGYGASGQLLTPSIAPTPPERPQSFLAAGATPQASSARLLAPSIAQPVAERPYAALWYGVGPSRVILVPSIAPPVPDRPYTTFASVQVAPASGSLLSPHVAPVTADAPASHLLAGIGTTPTGFLLVQTIAPAPPERSNVASLQGYGAAGQLLATPPSALPATAYSALVVPTLKSFAGLLQPSTAPLAPERPSTGLLVGVATVATGSILANSTVPILPDQGRAAPTSSILFGASKSASGSYLIQRLDHPAPIAPYSVLHGAGQYPVVSLVYVWMSATAPVQTGMDPTQPIQIPVMQSSTPVQVVILPPTRPS